MNSETQAPADANDDAGTLRYMGVTSGVLLVVANMIGVGVFTTTGFQIAGLGPLSSPRVILIGWLVGGISAFFGALAYAELGAALPRNGGEYQFLSRIYHPAVGFLSGWVSLIVGFSAPLAMMALAFGTYLHAIDERFEEIPAGLCLVGTLSLLQILNVGLGSRFQNVMSLGKIVLILGFIGLGCFYCDPGRLSSNPEVSLTSAVFSAPFATNLFYIAFTYSGWNAVGYMAGEFRRPERSIPLALIGGTGLVTVLYLGLNFVFLAALPQDQLAQAGPRVGYAAAVSLFGPQAATFFSLMLVLGLVSTVSALIMTGPRIYEAMGRDYPALRILTIRPAGGGPVVAILLQVAITSAMILSSSFEILLEYIGFTLSFFAGLTVLGVFVLRYREPNLPRPYRTWGYPITPLLFVALEVWMITHSVIGNRRVVYYGAGTLLAGLLIYTIASLVGRRSTPDA